jgi:hypothetical protein
MLVHFVGAYLHFERAAVRPRHRGMQRAVEVAFRTRDVIVELLRDRLPQIVDDAEHGIAVLDLVHQHAHAAHVVDLGEVERLLAHLVVDAVDVLGPAGDLGLDAGGREFARERRYGISIYH